MDCFCLLNGFCKHQRTFSDNASYVCKGYVEEGKQMNGVVFINNGMWH